MFGILKKKAIKTCGLAEQEKELTCEERKRKKATCPGAEIKNNIFRSEFRVARIMPLFGKQGTVETFGFLALVSDTKNYLKDLYEIRYTTSIDLNNIALLPSEEHQYIQVGDILVVEYDLKFCELKSKERYIKNKKSGEYIGEPISIINQNLQHIMRHAR